MVPLRGGGGGGVQILNAIAQSVQLTWLHFVADPPTLRSSSITKCLWFEILNRMVSVNGKKTSFQKA